MDIFLETTIQIHRIANTLVIKNAINKELRSNKSYTSSFVLREFIKTIIQDIAYVYYGVKSIEENDGKKILSELSFFLASGKGNFSPTAARREQLIIGSIIAEFPETNVPKKKLLSYLEMISEQWIEEFFNISSPNGKENIVQQNRFLTELDDFPDEMLKHILHKPVPKKPNFPKIAIDFLEKQKNRVKKIDIHLTRLSASKRDNRLLNILTKAKDINGNLDFKNQLSYNSKSIWALGDLLISLETPDYAEIYTTDKHYVHLTTSLGKKLYQGYKP